MVARKKNSTALLLVTIAAMSVGLIVGLALMLSKGAQSSQPAVTAQAGSMLLGSAPAETAPATRETIVISQPANEQRSPFLYENTRDLQRPPVKPFYLPTRGEPHPYQQLGILIGEERGAKGGQMILPLIGRQTHPGSSRYHYYTSTDGYHPMKLPVEHKKRTCNDSTGCDEIFSGNLVRVKGYDIDFNADVYPSADPVYIL
jgi:hypothetical protein